MKRLLVLLSLLFSSFTYADTINLHWLNDDGTVYENSTCEIDSDLILPSTPPTKYGYTFTGWKISNYTHIEYLESTGTQYIDTGIDFDSNLVQYPFKVDFVVAIVNEYTGNGNIVNNYFAGSSSANNLVMANMYLRWNSNNSITMRVSGDSTCAGFQNPSTGTPIHLVYLFDGNTYSVSGDMTLEQSPIPHGKAAPFTSNNNLYLFKANGIGGAVPIRIYSWVYESNGIKLRDFIPVLDGDGIPCLLDRVEGKFYYNRGTGQFIAGPVLTE